MLAPTIINLLQSGVSIQLEKRNEGILLTVYESLSKPGSLTASNYVFVGPENVSLDGYLTSLLKDLASNISTERQRQKGSFAASMDLEAEVE